MSHWWLRILRHSRPPKLPLAIIALLMVLASAVAALAPWPLKLIVDLVLQPEPEVQRRHAWVLSLPGVDGFGAALIVWLCGGMIVLFLLAQSIRLAHAYMLAGLGSRLTYGLGADLLARLQELSLIFHTKQRVGDMVKRVTADAGCARDLVCGVLVPGARSLVDLLVMFAFMYQINQGLALIAIAFAAPLMVMIRWCSKPLAERSYEQQKVEGELYSLADQTLGALPAVQSFTLEPVQNRQYRDLHQTLLKRQLDSMWAQLRFKFGTSGVTALGTVVVMLLGAMAVIDGKMTLGGLLVFLAYLASLYAPLETLSYLSGSYATATGGARRVLEVLDSAERISDVAGATPLPVVTAELGLSVGFDHVTFGYTADALVLRDVSLSIPPGQVVALVGATGAGKSTLMSLVPRLFDVRSGAVTVSGIDVRKLQLASLREQIAVVPQEPLLLPLSVAQNIAYARPGASESEIRAAAEAANAHEFISQMEKGYESVLGARGGTLSVGQRQRLAIARALLKNAPILLLDEPTSALDALTEQSVVEALSRLMKGRTCLIIAHRLSTIRRVDRIIVLDRGQIVQDGTYAELVEQEGPFRKMHEAAHSSVLVAGVGS